MAFRTFDVYKTPPPSSSFKDPLPETYNQNRDLIPDDTFVLIGYCKSQEHYEWILKNGLYNFRVGADENSLKIDYETVSSKYLLIHKAGDKNSGDLWKIVSKGARIYSKNELLQKGYPNPNQDIYFVVEIEKITDLEFLNSKWNFKNLKNYSPGRASAKAFTSNLTELMLNKEK
jgi:hypothetical protein